MKIKREEHYSSTGLSHTYSRSIIILLVFAVVLSSVAMVIFGVVHAQSEITDTTPPTPILSTTVQKGTTPDPVPITVNFGEAINIATLEPSDIVISSGTVQNPRPVHLFNIGSSGSEDGEFRNPYSITTNATGHIFVADRNNDRVQIFGTDRFTFDIAGPTINQLLTVQMSASAVTDIAGNLSAASNQLSVEYGHIAIAGMYDVTISDAPTTTDYAAIAGMYDVMVSDAPAITDALAVSRTYAITATGSLSTGTPSCTYLL